MLGYIAGRLLQAAPVLLLSSIAVFLVLRLVPGDPASTLVGDNATPERLQQVREQLGLTDSWPQQYARWLGNVARGDLGTSYRSRQSVGRMLRQALPPTVELAVAAYPVALALGIPLGVLAGVRPRSVWDWALSGFTPIAVGIPNFLLGIVLLFIFAVQLGWLPAAGRVNFLADPVQSLRYLALPALALGCGLAAVLARYTRTAVAEVMGHDYIRTARAKGLRPDTVIIRHALRNALVPVVTIVALQVGNLLAGAVVIEQVYTRPGLGRLVVEAVLNRDYLIVQGALIVLVTVFVTVNLAADLAYGFLDPRIRRR
jgi:peptide/nickel transport system permease protein